MSDVTVVSYDIVGAIARATARSWRGGVSSCARSSRQRDVSATAHSAVRAARSRRATTIPRKGLNNRFINKLLVCAPTRTWHCAVRDALALKPSESAASYEQLGLSEAFTALNSGI